MNMKLGFCLACLFLLLTGCANQYDAEKDDLEEERDRISLELDRNPLPIDGACSSEVGQCAPGLSIEYDHVCEGFCDYCWYCAGLNGGTTSELCLADICGTGS